MASNCQQVERFIDIDTFVPEESIGWVWYDRHYLLAPDGKVGEEAFAVIREAMKATGQVGIARLVLSNRERAVMLKPRDKGIIVTTLRYGDEVRDADEYFEDVENQKPPAKALGLARKVLAKDVEKWSPKFSHDHLQDRLGRLIKKRTAEVKKQAEKKPAAEKRKRPATAFPSPMHCAPAWKRKSGKEAERGQPDTRSEVKIVGLAS